MKNIPVIVWIFIGVLVIVATYEFFILTKINKRQLAIEESLKKLLPEEEETEAEVVETKKGNKDKQEKKSTTDEETTKEEINDFAVKIAGRNKPLEFTDDEKQFYENNKESIEQQLLNMAKQEQSELEEEAIALIGKGFDKLKTKTKLNNHIEKLDELLKEGKITDEKILNGAREKIKSCAEFLTTFDSPKKTTGKKKDTDKKGKDEEDEGSGESEDNDKNNED